ncbi:MAG TPA: DUF3106 domain-containing protein [Verrucomicrobiae bacterium]|jgi:predicted Fe-S protein YdhL (DUF1289 family)|nr:DUF3106 domain-containing protein [Verrucomicrobiae bacterium]
MNHFRQGRRWLVLVPVAVLFISSVSAQNVTKLAVPKVSVPAAMIPPVPVAPSPVYYFRKLLAMSPPQLQGALAQKPPKVRERILAKVSEYAALDPDERELRLRATELRWYLMPILQAPADQRSAQLAQIPADMRDLVQSRVMEWEILPPTLQQEFLDNQHIAGYFAGLNTTNDNSDASAPSAAEQSRWNAYSETERQAMIGEFDNFYNLSPMEKQKALGQLTDVERKQMESTLQAFAKLPMRQRVQCIRAFGEFASMSGAERAEFLKNAQRWSKMTQSERQAWRDLVAHVPQWPPLPPPAIMPPMPPTITPPAPPAVPSTIRVVVTTNHD